MKFALVLMLAFSSNLFSQEKSLEELKKVYARPSEIPFPPNNQYTKGRELLGKKLFFDPRLSGSGVMSCATCHNPSFSWGDGLKKGIGHGHVELGRRTPTILNLAWAPKLFWDGRADSLEDQALGPIASAGEMNMPLSKMTNKMTKIYKKELEENYPGEPLDEKLIAKAIAVFERTIVSGEAPFDKWLKGDEGAISESAKKGFLIFNGKANCASCHSGWSFTDHSFHNIGINDNDIGRGKFLKLKSMQYAFKTPTLRNVNHRGPYMHDGSLKSLEDVVEFYNAGGASKRDNISHNVTSLNLGRDEVKQLVAFLNTLTSTDAAIELPVLPNE